MYRKEMERDSHSHTEAPRHEEEKSCVGGTGNLFASHRGNKRTEGIACKPCVRFESFIGLRLERSFGGGSFRHPNRIVRYVTGGRGMVW